ncbi:unnamed protein product [Lymnaea stagnalis]|uniref:RING-type domain-containing protein n=1 Tax=Lymnaea stagnalis TaxID=6523 RepID=A0AAV2I8I2_LYMST
MEGSSDLKLRTLLCLFGLACMSQCVGHTNKSRPSTVTSGKHGLVQRFKSDHCQMLEEASNLKRGAPASKSYGTCYQIQRFRSEFFSCPTHSYGKLHFHVCRSMKSCGVEIRNVRRLFSKHSKMVEKRHEREDQHEDDVISEPSATQVSMADRTPKTTASFCDSSTPLSSSDLFNLWISLCDTIWCNSKKLPTALTSDLRRIRLLFCIIILCYALSTVTSKFTVKTDQTLSLKPIWRPDHLSAAMFDASPKMISGKYVNVKRQCFYDWLFLPFREVGPLKDLIVLPVLEMKRLASFRALSYAEIPDSMFFTKLAEAGFFYTGTGNEVTCCGCRSTLTVASIGSDASDPRYHRESCRFVTGTELAGHPVVIVSQPDDGFQEAGTEDTFGYAENESKFDPSRELAPSHARRFQRNLSSSSTSSNSSGYSSASISSPPSRRGSHVINQESVSENQQSQTATSANGATLPAGATNHSNGQEAPGRLILTNPSYPVYIAKQKRLESFANWAAGHIHTPVALASAGFFYAGYGDCVRCFQCGLGLRSWKPGDDINEEHERHRPSCPFLRVQKNNSSTTTSLGASSLSRGAGHPANRAGNSSNHEHDVSTATLTSEVDESRGRQTVTPQQASNAREKVIRSSRDPAENVAINALQRENETLLLQMMCKICLTAPIRDLFLPCGDLYACTECSKQLTHCPACNKLILATVTTYFS